MKTMLVVAGWGQLALALGSLAIPGVLGWREDTAKLNPLTRQVFWTYAAYIWTFNLAFGVISAGAPHLLLTGETLARVVNGVIAVYWGVRVLVQFFWFDRSQAPQGRLYTLAEYLLVLLFVYLTAVYTTLARGGW